jgi:glycosyltransferase involved in cell wall biosynthesis
MKLNYSFIIPVYNRPQEVMELLDSFLDLQFKERFEIVIIEDGSSEKSEDIISVYSDRLNISYYYKDNSGPGASRNFGMQRAKGDYFIILDSDCLLTNHYLETVDAFLNATFFHCYGGADAAHLSFTPLQKAINYTMTSFITTGGIRGSEKSVTDFEPRSFNMGMSKEAFLKTGGYAKIHPGEDPDLSQRIKKEGYSTTFIPNAHVFHKRRISWKKFYTQVNKFGMVRPILNTWHPTTAKITFWFPTTFMVFVVLSIFMSALLLDLRFMLPLLLYLGVILFGSSFRNKSVYIGLLSIIAVFVQFFGYGLGFFKSTLFVRILNKDPQKQFPNLFFK